MAIDLTKITIDYTSKDFLAFRRDMLSLADTFTPEWTNRADSDLGMLLINEFAMGMDILSFYQDRDANEGFLPTAQLRSSVIKLLSLIDYQLSTPVSASVDLIFTITVQASDTIIFKGFKVSTQKSTSQDAVPFQTTEQLVIPAGYQGYSVPNALVPIGSNSATFDSVVGMTIGEKILIFNGVKAEYLTVTGISSLTVSWLEPTEYAYTSSNTIASGLYVNAIQGTQISSEVIGTSDGNPLQTYELGSTPVELGTLQIVVNESGTLVEWERIDSIITANSSSRIFTTTVDELDKVTIIFGDGNLGKIPPLTSQITSAYVVGGGLIGNVGVGTINKLVSSLAAGKAVINPLAASGGADRESLDHARVYGPLSVKTNDRAVTKADYEALAGGFSSENGAVEKAAAVATTYSNVDIYGATEGGAMSTALKNDLKAYLDSKSVMFISTTIFDATYTGINISISVKALPNYIGADVLGFITAALDEYLSFSNMAFGNTLHLSDVYFKIANLTGVDSIVVTAFYANTQSPGVYDDITADFNEIFIKDTFTLTLV